MLKKTSVFLATLAVACLVAASPASAATYKVDPAHSSVLFKIRHLVSKVTGRFGTFEGTVEIDPNNRDAVTVAGSIDAASINTDNPKRDQHLRSQDFFDVDKFPQIIFKGGTLSDVNADKSKGVLNGNLTIHGVTRPVAVHVEWLGTVSDPMSKKNKAGFDATTTINRKDFGIIWNKTLDTGGVMLGDDVDIELHVEMAEATAG